MTAQKNSHITVNSPSGRLGDTNLAVSDKAAEVCPVGAIIKKRHGFAVPIGERLYDHKTIREVQTEAHK